ncbi:MAG: serine/threonine-protein kinase [Pirellulaceae bacterium]
MDISLKQFVENLADSSLMELDEIQKLREGISREEQPADGMSFARWLVKAEKLTAHQAERICKGQQNKLLLGNYVILEQIGRGGMGVVYKARHRRMKRDVAIKVLSEKLTNSETRLRRFHREVEAAARLVHPNIVTAFDADKDERTFFLVMEFVNGRDMAAIVEDEGPLPVAVALDYIIQTARGLEYAHGEGIVHRDIKPHNLLVTSSGTVKVLDLGLVSLKTDDEKKESSESLTANNQIIGTVDYMSPEQAEDVHTVDLRADIYSLGCTLYRILIDEPPFGGKNAIQKLMAHRTHPIPSLRAKRSDIPELLDRAFRRMVAKRPEDRYQSMGEVIESMETCTLALISVGTTSTVQMSSPFETTAAAEVASTVNIQDKNSSLNAINLETSRPEGSESISIMANHPSPKQRQRREEKTSPLTSLLAVVGILVLVMLAWFLSRPTQIVLDWPVSERQGFDLYVNDRAIEYGNSMPLAIPVNPGKNKIVIQRIGYYHFNKTVHVERRETVSIPVKLEKVPDFNPELSVEENN